MKKLIFALMLSLGLLVSAPAIAAGNCEIDSNNTKICNPLAVDNVTDLILQVINWLFAIIGLLTVLFVMIGGYKYVTSQGDDKAVGAAKKTVTNALIGMTLVLLSYSIVSIVANTITSGGGGGGGLRDDGGDRGDGGDLPACLEICPLTITVAPQTVVYGNNFAITSSPTGTLGEDNYNIFYTFQSPSGTKELSGNTVPGEPDSINSNELLSSAPTSNVSFQVSVVYKVSNGPDQGKIIARGSGLVVVTPPSGVPEEPEN